MWDRACSHVFVFDRRDCEIVAVIKCDSHIVNCVQVCVMCRCPRHLVCVALCAQRLCVLMQDHPSQLMLAVSGIDSTPKLLWPGDAPHLEDDGGAAGTMPGWPLDVAPSLSFRLSVSHRTAVGDTLRGVQVLVRTFRRRRVWARRCRGVRRRR
jgi:hypothetical protein